MTLRKYKKLLMSYGIDRDQAEEDRKDLARWRRFATLLGMNSQGTSEWTSVEFVVSDRKKHGTTSRRGCIKYMKELFENVTTV